MEIYKILSPISLDS